MPRIPNLFELDLDIAVGDLVGGYRIVDRVNLLIMIKINDRSFEEVSC
jgi:hypothetical protein